jgi:hypothetical protein
MRAFEIIRSGGFGPAEIARLDAVFANAWTELADRYANVHGEGYEKARERLASIVIALGKKSLDDAQLVAIVVAAFEGK